MANEPLRMLTAFHSPFYAPVYVARRLGLFAEEGLDITIATPEPGKTVDALASGDADIALSGVMRAHVCADQGGPQRFLTIAEVPNDTQMAAVLLAAGSGGGVTDLKTTVAMTSIEAKGAFAAASDLAPGFKSAGGA